MRIIRREEITKTKLPGRILQVAVGKEAQSRSGKMMVGFAHYSAESGPMEPHQHIEEVIYVLDARKGWCRYGSSKDQLVHRVLLENGTILHIPPLEWHVFEYDENGHVDILFVYGQVENIYPEKSN